MFSTIAKGLLIPFLGTTLGSACVFFMKNKMSIRLQKSLSGFAAGVMVAASVWSLLIPSMSQAEELGMGKLAFIPAVVGFCLGMLFLLLLDILTPHMHINETVEGPKSKLKKSTMMVLAVTLHNIPEGMSVGVTFAGAIIGNAGVTMAGAFALAVGIAIQNFPEGAIVSMPLCAQGHNRHKAFMQGTLSGLVEPVASFITIMASSLIMPFLPYLLSFAAGAMLYVVVEELIPEMSQGSHSNKGTVFFAIGFVIMMILDTVLG